MNYIIIANRIKKINNYNRVSLISLVDDFEWEIIKTFESSSIIEINKNIRNIPGNYPISERFGMSNIHIFSRDRYEVIYYIDTNKHLFLINGNEPFFKQKIREIILNKLYEK